MKKSFLISLFICCNLSLVAFSSQWIEVYNKVYVNIDKYENNKVFYWAKHLNNGSMEPIKNQKVNYIMGYSVEDCSQNSSGVLASYSYSLSGKTLSSYTSPHYNNPQWVTFEPVVPQSVGEQVHKYVCGYSQ